MSIKTQEKFSRMFSDLYRSIDQQFGKFSERYWIASVKATAENYEFLKSVKTFDATTHEAIKRIVGDYKSDNLIDVLLTKLPDGQWLLSLVHDGVDLSDNLTELETRRIEVVSSALSALEYGF